ncbi:hypothetical protein MUP77_01990 [Candidatus Bathyarchaeota archaeon]|nr:hypothetical protein [Candidatus Bathyarchaeota archaeon]
MVFDIALRDSGTAFNISFGGVTISYRALFFSSPSPPSGFISITDGVKPQFKCPNCKYIWQSLKQAAYDINELVMFACPTCQKIIALYVATYGGLLCIQRSDGQGASGIPEYWWQGTE